MATFIALVTETQYGESHISESVSRAKEFMNSAAEFGATIKGLYWTMGTYDGVIIFDAPDDESAAAMLHRLQARGAVRTQTLRAFDADQMSAILKRVQG